MVNDVARRLLALPLLLFPLSLAAVIFQPLSIKSLSSEADLVLQGVVQSKSCQRDGAGRIYTRIELEVTDVWKGAVGTNPFLIVHGGGVLGEEQSIVSGQVQYEVGEEVVAFLVRNSRGEGVTLGLMQGKFHVWKDAVSGIKYATSPFHGLPETGANVLLQNASGTKMLPAVLRVSELKARVLEVVR